MHHYPCYRIEDFYQKSFKQGGLTLGQIQVLFEYYVKKENENYKFHAAIQGIDLEKEANKASTGSKPQSRANTKTPNNNALPMFGAPEDYTYLSEEEKKELTAKMMGSHRSWVNKEVPNTMKGKK